MQKPSFIYLFFKITDFGFLIYWVLSLCMAMGLKILSPELMYYGYGDRIIMGWNWSFFPIDILAAIFGLVALYAAKGQRSKQLLFILSATFTFSAGLMAISFWTFIGFFDPTWWGLNLFLLLWPAYFLYSELVQVF